MEVLEESGVRPIVHLHVFRQTGCEACAAAEPHIQALIQKHPLRVLVVPHNFTYAPGADVLGWSPDGTPGYAVVIEGEIVATHVGTLTLKQLERLIGEDL